MVFRHVVLQLFGIGTWGRFPSRLLLGMVEVIRKVLGVTVADFPARRKACVGLLCIVSCQLEVVFCRCWDVGLTSMRLWLINKNKGKARNKEELS